MPIACNPLLEANQREGKVSVKQSQALFLPRSPFHHFPEAPDAFLSLLFRSNLPFLSAEAWLHSVPICLSQLQSRDGAQAQPRGAAEKGNPQDDWSGHGHPKTCNQSYSTLFVPGKHLLSSLAQMLASNLPPHSCLVMPIRVYTTLCSRDGEKRR